MCEFIISCILGYFLGFAIFIIGIPVLMWLVSGRHAFSDIPAGRLYLSALICIAGLLLSVWSIVFMKRVGKGNPFLYRNCHRLVELAGTFGFCDSNRDDDDASNPLCGETPGGGFRRGIPGL